MTHIEEVMIYAHFKEVGYKEATNGFVIDNNTAEEVETKFYNLTGVRFEECEEEMIKAVYGAFFKGYYERKAEEWVKMWKNKVKE